MADVTMSSPLVKPKLGLMGASMNAMALIAPGAFLWITYQLQAAATAPSGASVASDIWAGIVVALVLAFLTAIFVLQLAKAVSRSGIRWRSVFWREGLPRTLGSQERRADFHGAHGKAQHGLGGAPVLLGLSGSHGCFHGHPDQLHLQPVHGKSLSVLELTLIGVILQHRDRLHCVSRDHRGRRSPLLSST